jgi:ribonuclease HII
MKATRVEAGCDEAGRGCLAGPVTAAAVILDPKKRIKGLEDSKKLSEKQRNRLRLEIEEKALAWAVCFVGPREIEEINILHASIAAIQRAVQKLEIQPEHLLIDGNRFSPIKGIEHTCVIKGDGIYQSIAAASILAKTHRDELMCKLHASHDQYDWLRNKGYPTISHREAIQKFGTTTHHRTTFKLLKDEVDEKS